MLSSSLAPLFDRVERRSARAATQEFASEAEQFSWHLGAAGNAANLNISLAAVRETNWEAPSSGERKGSSPTSNRSGRTSLAASCDATDASGSNALDVIALESAPAERERLVTSRKARFDERDASLDE